MKVKLIGNISDYEQKAVGIFSARQIGFSLLGTAAGIGVYLALKPLLPSVISTIAAAAVGLVIIALGFLQLGGVPAAALIGCFFRLLSGQGKRKYIMEEEDAQEEKEN